MTSSPTRRSRAERREQIAAAALGIIGSAGIQSLSTAALASAVGVTTGALFRHFRSLEEILDSAVELAATRIEATFPATDLPPTERLRQLADARIRLFTDQPGIGWMLRSHQALLALSPTAVAQLQGLARRSRAYLRRALKEGIATGDVRDDLPLDTLLLVFTSSVHALMPRPAHVGQRARRPRHARVIDQVLTLIRPQS